MNTRVKIALLASLFLFSIYSITNNTPIIISGNTVLIDYYVWVGPVLIDNGTISFVVGQSEVITGLDNAIVGMRVGESKNITIPPLMAYGLRDPDLVFVVPVGLFSENNMSTPLVGDLFEIYGTLGEVIEVTNDTVIVDANDPLAGLTLDMSIKVINKA
ncbi:MAG: FKBP-type peptidyl-prolyl cis-trans isomerase [Candidatus Nanoarchaeia archaeon]|jgi:FKBP-type peptidyl-prolyl cis-trans isomerase 2